MWKTIRYWLLRHNFRPVLPSLRFPNVVELCDSQCKEQTPESVIGVFARFWFESIKRVVVKVNWGVSGWRLQGPIWYKSLCPHKWLVCWQILPRGVGPKRCQWIFRKKGSMRGVWKRYKEVLFPNPRGPVGIFTAHTVFGPQVSQTTWFYPNNICFRGKARHSIVSLLFVPDALHVIEETCFTIK